MPGLGEQVKSVRRKGHALDLEFRNQNALVDDSIVRGSSVALVHAVAHIEFNAMGGGLSLSQQAQRLLHRLGQLRER